MAENTKAQSRQGRAPRARGEAAADRPSSVRRAPARRGAATGQTTAAPPLQGAAARGVRRGAKAFAETTRQAGQATEHAMLAAGEAADRTASAAAEGGYGLLDATASEFAEMSRRMAYAVEETAGEMRRMMMLPRLANGAMREAQRAMGDLMDNMAQANFRIAREAMRIADPTMAFDLQRRFLRECVEALMQGCARMLGAARRSAEQTLRPMEEQLEEACARSARMGAGWPSSPSGRGQHQPGHRVAEAMRIGTRMVGPEETVQEAARVMAAEDAAVLPVGEDRRVLGVVTGRDLAVRLIAEGRDPARTPVREVMRARPPCTFADEDAGRAVETMTAEGMSGLPVVSRDDHRFLGVVALADLAARGMSGNGAAAAWSDDDGARP